MPESNVYLGDCMDFMRTLPDKFFDLAVVDPPYGINATEMQMGHHPTRSGNGQCPGQSTAVKIRKKRLNCGSGKLKNRILNKAIIDWDNERPSQEYFDELIRVSVNQIICGGNYFDLPPSRGVGCWDKMQPWDNFSQWEMLWTSFDVPAWIYRYSNTGGANEEKKIHPTQKPPTLYKFVYNKFARSQQRIFDSHMGSQSSRIAAYDLGFDYWGCEKDPDYFRDGCKRFDNFKAQLKLF